MNLRDDMTDEGPSNSRRGLDQLITVTSSDGPFKPKSHQRMDRQMTVEDFAELVQRYERDGGDQPMLWAFQIPCTGFTLDWISESQLERARCTAKIRDSCFIAEMRKRVLSRSMLVEAELKSFENLEKFTIVGAPMKVRSQVPYAFSMWFQVQDQCINLFKYQDRAAVERWCNRPTHIRRLKRFEHTHMLAGDACIVRTGEIMYFMNPKQDKVLVAAGGYFLPYPMIGEWAYWLSKHFQYPGCSFTDVREHAGTYLRVAAEIVDEAVLSNDIEVFGGAEVIAKFREYKMVRPPSLWHVYVLATNVFAQICEAFLTER